MAVTPLAFGTQGKVTITHPEKVVFPELRLTKGDVADFYRRIAPRLLPYLRDRPVTLERLPDGVGPGKKQFYQKNIPAQYPDWIPRASCPPTAERSSITPSSTTWTPCCISSTRAR